MKILYVHFRPAKSESQVKAVADKVKLLGEVSVLGCHLVRVCVSVGLGANWVATPGDARDLHEG